MPSAAVKPSPSRSNLDLEFAQQGGEDPTAYEVLLHAAIIGDTQALHAAGQYRGDLANHGAPD
jgi:hypothetical protein